MFFNRFTRHLLLLCLFWAQGALADDHDYQEPAYEQTYQEETYQEETYQEESYVEESYEESNQDSEQSFSEPSPPETAYQDSGFEQAPMDQEQAAMVKEARANCQQWAQESGLEGEDKNVFIEDCVYSQTGF